MKKRWIIIVILLFCLALSGCPKLQQWILQRNDEIDQDLLDEMYMVDAEVIESLKNADIDNFSSKCSDELFEVANADELGEFVILCSKNIGDSEYKYKDMFYCRFKSISDEVWTVFQLSNYDVQLNLIPVNKNIFVSMILFDKGDYEVLLSIQYIWKNEVWEIASIDVREHSYGGMNAMDYYEKAKEQEEEGLLLPAAVNVYAAYQMHQLSSFANYYEVNDIIVYADEVNKKFGQNYTFPIVFDIDGSTFEVFSIESKLTLQGYFPKINYIMDITAIDENSEEIEVQAELLHKEIIEYFSGLDEEFDCIIYTGYNDYPTDPNKTYNSYTTIFE